MKGKKKEVKEYRISLVINPVIKEHLERMQALTGESQSEIIRKAIEFFYLFCFNEFSFLDIIKPIKRIAEDLGIELEWGELRILRDQKES